MNNKIAFALLTVFISFLSLFAYNKVHNIEQKLNNKKQTLSFKKEDLIDEISKKILLPKNEIPIIARVNQESINNNKNLLKDAKIGDYLLIYSSKRQAIVYRQSEKKIINVDIVKINKK